jgi:starch synthase (maltosyl-transferring)
VGWDLRRWLRKRPGAVRQSFLFHANVLTNHVDATPTEVGRRFAGIRVAEHRPGRLWLEKMALRRAAKIVCVSSAVQSFARQQFGGDPERMVMIPNSVDVDRFASAPPADLKSLGWPAGAKVVLFVGRLHPQKNLESIQASLDAFAPPGENVRLLIIGDGPQRNLLQQWANTVSGDRVRLLPWQSNISPFVAASDVLILPSHYEGMPNVVMEAMAAAKPVVCSRIEGSVELLGDDAHQGFRPGDRHGMIERLNQFLHDPELAISIGRQNQNRMREQFSVQRMVYAYRDLYLNANRG